MSKFNSVSNVFIFCFLVFTPILIVYATFKSNLNMFEVMLYSGVTILWFITFFALAAPKYKIIKSLEAKLQEK